jgi:hypothetical protein
MTCAARPSAWIAPKGTSWRETTAASTSCASSCLCYAGGVRRVVVDEDQEVFGPVVDDTVLLLAGGAPDPKLHAPSALAGDCPAITPLSKSSSSPAGVSLVGVVVRKRGGGALERERVVDHQLAWA